MSCAHTSLKRGRCNFSSAAIVFVSFMRCMFAGHVQHILQRDACLLDIVRHNVARRCMFARHCPTHNVAQRCTFALQCPTHFKGLVEGIAITITHEPKDMYQSSKKVWLVVGTTSFSIVVILYMVCMHVIRIMVRAMVNVPYEDIFASKSAHLVSDRPRPFILQAILGPRWPCPLILIRPPNSFLGPMWSLIGPVPSF